MKVLISAIACDPHGISEGLHGWMACRSLSTLADLWLIVSGEMRPGIEKAQATGDIPDNMHFTYIGENKPYHPNRMVARFEGWFRYMKFNRQILPVAQELHKRVGFDLAQHVTYSTWRVGCPLWRLGIPLIWGPISGTEVFPLGKLGGTLSLKSYAFEVVRKMGGVFSYLSPEVHQSARNSFHIIAAHREAVPFLAKLRKSPEGISVLSYYSFSPDRFDATSRKSFPVREARPLKIFASGNLEGRKGVAIALRGLRMAKDQGVKFAYRITSRGPEFDHLNVLAGKLGLADEVSLGQRFPRDGYIQELWDTDIYLLPSLREGGGLSMMEAMVAGCVPIVADCGGPGTAVTDECGVRIPVASMEKMAADISAAIVRLDKNRALLAKMGEAAQKRIIDNYSEQRFISSMKNVYNLALAGRTSAAPQTS